MKFLNRLKELAVLDRLIKSKQFEFAVVWGRRRMGKTRLLLEWAEKNQGVYYVADESAPHVQRKFFSLALEEVLPGFSNVEYPDWRSLFGRLASDAKSRNWCGPLIVDEIPYWLSNSPELASVLQAFLDHEAKRANLVIVVAGSSQQMMLSNVLNSSAPLYGRASEIIKLGSIPIGYLLEAFDFKSPSDCIEFYSVFGGVPRYWELAQRFSGNLISIIEQLVLDPMGALHEEPYRLLREESPSAINLKPILDAIGLGAQRLSEIAGRINTPATSLSRSIEKLIELELIEKEVPYGAKIHHSKKTLYKIKDPFLNFWFKVVAPRKSFLIQSDSKTRRAWLGQQLPKIVQARWEELCRTSISKLSDLLGNDFEPGMRYWHGQGPEWDVVSSSYDKKQLLLGEAKWPSKTPKDFELEGYLSRLISKGVPPVNRLNDVLIKHVLFVSKNPSKEFQERNKQICFVDSAELVRRLK